MPAGRKQQQRVLTGAGQLIGLPTTQRPFSTPEEVIQRNSCCTRRFDPRGRLPFGYFFTQRHPMVLHPCRETRAGQRTAYWHRIYKPSGVKLFNRVIPVSDVTKGCFKIHRIRPCTTFVLGFFANCQLHADATRNCQTAVQPGIFQMLSSRKTINCLNEVHCQVHDH